MKLSQIFLLVISMLVFSCSTSTKEEDQETVETGIIIPEIAVVNYPLKYFAERIAGDRISVLYPIPSDIDPAYWEPSPEDISIYQNADLVLLNGAGYAKWIQNATLPASRMIYTSDGAKNEYIEASEGITHSHGGEEEHTHTDFAIHTWLDMKIAKIQAESVYSSLLKLLPDDKDLLDTNYQQLIVELNELDQAFTNVLAGKPVMYASHPVYQYLAQGYGIEIYSVHWEPIESVSADQWHEMEHLMEDHAAGIMLWEGEPHADVAKKLSDNGIEPVVFTTCDRTPTQGDFLTLMKANIESLSTR